MCGICGIIYSINNKKIVKEPILRSMASTLYHRGPDCDGYYINPSKKSGLGFRRLSIIDLATGDQPLSNEDGSIWVSLNGEIYNFGHLRRELEAHGHIFRTLEPGSGNI